MVPVLLGILIPLAAWFYQIKRFDANVLSRTYVLESIIAFLLLLGLTILSPLLF